MFFYDLLSQATYAVGGIASLLNKLPIFNIDTDWIFDKADEFANKASDAWNAKNPNISYSAAFNAAFEDG